jgi:hypothetical protein
VKAFIIIVLCACFATVGAGAGRWYEDRVIQATCEDDNAHTLINGVQYECMSPKLAQQMRIYIEKLIAALTARQEKGA